MGRFAAGMRRRGAEQHLDDEWRGRAALVRSTGNIKRPNGRAAAPSRASSTLGGDPARARKAAPAAKARVADLMGGEDIVVDASLIEDILHLEGPDV
jgi:hypothetical protein